MDAGVCVDIFAKVACFYLLFLSVFSRTYNRRRSKIPTELNKTQAWVVKAKYGGIELIPLCHCQWAVIFIYGLAGPEKIGFINLNRGLEPD
jgi:hypothetical protein